MGALGVGIGGGPRRVTRVRWGSVVEVAVALGLAVACTTAGGKPVVIKPPSGGCDLGARPWQQTSIGPCAASTWNFVPAPDGTFQANETGCADGTGIASYDGSVVKMTFKYTGGAGFYSWPLDQGCISKPGTVTWTEGTLTGQTLASTLSPAP